MYDIEVVLCSKNGWFTPAEARSYYGKYSRDGITWHWWGDGTGASNHDNIVRYLNGKGAAGQAPTVNYVLSDNKITMCVDPNNVAWASGNGNATTVSVELQPTLGDEGYKKAGWLAWQLEQRYGKTLTFYPHKYWMQTECPGTISLDRIRQEATKWKNGGYNPAPPTPTPPATANLTWSKFVQTQTYVCNKQPTHLWNFNQTSWSGFTNPVKDFNQGEKVDIYGQVVNETIGATYYLTEYSYTKGITNGFNKVDLDIFIATPPSPDPQPTPPVDPAPQPTPPDEPEWVTNLRDIDETKYWIRADTQLIDITTGNPSTPGKLFAKDDEFVASALTIARGVEYRITEYSFQKKIFNGIKLTDLTLTAPGEPDVPPVPDNPDLIEKSVVIAFLESIVKLIVAFIEKLKG